MPDAPQGPEDKRVKRANSTQHGAGSLKDSLEDSYKSKVQYSGHLMQRVDLLEKTPMMGKIEGSRRRG